MTPLDQHVEIACSDSRLAGCGKRVVTPARQSLSNCLGRPREPSVWPAPLDATGSRRPPADEGPGFQHVIVSSGWWAGVTDVGEPAFGQQARHGPFADPCARSPPPPPSPAQPLPSLPRPYPLRSPHPQPPPPSLNTSLTSSTLLPPLPPRRPGAGTRVVSNAGFDLGARLIALCAGGTQRQSTVGVGYIPVTRFRWWGKTRLG